MSNKETVAEISKALEPLAQKLGEGAGHVYEVYLRQMFMEGAFNLIASISMAIIIVIVATLYLNYMNKVNPAEKGANIVLVCLVLSIPMTVIILSSLGNVTKMLNPEYHAIQRIVEQVRSE